MLFIVDGIISLPIALLGYFFLPDLPETSRAFYFSKDVRFPRSSFFLHRTNEDRNWNSESDVYNWKAVKADNRTRRLKFGKYSHHGTSMY